MRLVIYTRQEVDWGNMSYGQFYDQKGRQLPDLAKIAQQQNIPEKWDSIFSITYFQFRQLVKDLASHINTQVQDATIIRGHENLRSELLSSEDACIVPTDDDDCFAPHLVDITQNFDDSNINFLIWPDFRLDGLTTRLDHTYDQMYPPTNGYAFRKNFLKSQFDENTIFDLLTWHYKIYNTIDRKSATILDTTYSIANKHLATTYNIGKRLTCRKYHGKWPCDICFKELMIRSLKELQQPILPEVCSLWVRKIVGRMSTLYRSMRVLKKEPTFL